MVASLRAGWRWWRTLSQNPIYQRELDTWGSANPFYASLRRYLPLLILLGLLLGVCTTVSNPTLFANNELMSLVYCLLCLPGMLINFVTIYGLFTAPALTAPMISAVLALVASYSAVILLKLFNSSVLWGMAASQVSPSRTTAFLASSLAPVLVYGLISAVGFALIEWRIRQDLL